MRLIALGIILGVIIWVAYTDGKKQMAKHINLIFIAHCITKYNEHIPLNNKYKLICSKIDKKGFEI